MPYSAPLDVLARWPKVHTSTFSHDELRVMIGDADAIINAKIAVRYTVPVATDPSNTPTLLKKLSAELALLDVFDRAQTTPDWIRSRFERDYQILDALANGDMVLVTDGGGLIPQTADIDVPGSTTSEYIPVFGGVPSLAEGYDSVRAQDEDNARGVITANHL